MTFRRLAILVILLVTATVALSGCSGASAAPLPAAPEGAASPTALPGSPCTAASADTTQSTAGAPAASACSTNGGPASGKRAGGVEAAFGVAVPVDGGSYTSVRPALLDGMLKAKDFKLVNVHSPYAGEIPGTDLWLPYDQVEQRLGELPSDKAAKILVYCRSGMMSDIAARALVKAGYTNIWNLEGGMSGWEQAGYPLISQK